MKAKALLFLHVTVIAILMIGISEVLAQVSTWQPPPAGTPPNCPAGYAGCDAPINVGGASQTKTGLLGLANLIVTSSFQLTSGTPTLGKVLTSDGSGIASWKDIGFGKIQKGSVITGVYTSKQNATPGSIRWGSGVTPCSNSQNDLPCGFPVTFAAGVFSSAPNVIVTPRWIRYTGDEVPFWFVTSVTSSGFTLWYHSAYSSVTTYNDAADGAGRVDWMAVGD